MSRRSSKPALTIEEILADHSPQIRDLTRRLAALVRETVPETRETVHRSWHSINYRDPVSGYFCGIFPRQDPVQVVFEFGVLLPDPDDLLQGAGKQVRYAEIREGDDIQEAQLRRLLLAALDLPPSRDVKLAMVRSGIEPLDSTGDS